MPAHERAARANDGWTLARALAPPGWGYTCLGIGASGARARPCDAHARLALDPIGGDPVGIDAGRAGGVRGGLRRGAPGFVCDRCIPGGEARIDYFERLARLSLERECGREGGSEGVREGGREGEREKGREGERSAHTTSSEALWEMAPAGCTSAMMSTSTSPSQEDIGKTICSAMPYPTLG